MYFFEVNDGLISKKAKANLDKAGAQVGRY